jgi:hypothetical protein
MNRKLAFVIVCLPVLVGLLFSAVVSAEISVGVEQGDWIEYQISTVGAVPPEHDVEGAKIEVLAVEGETIDVKFTSKFSDGTEDAVTSTLNLVTGQIGDAFIIPANLNAGDTFLDLEQIEGSITLSGVEERTFVGERRTVVYASTSETMFYWDRSTGVLVEATTSTSDFTLTTRAEKTNIWKPQIFGLDPIIIIVLIIVVVTAVSAIFLILKARK